jgi:putative endonuclease
VSLGIRGERIAARMLKRAGYRIVTRNYKCSSGEIDLIAVDDDTLVFVEVKTRTSSDAAYPEVTVHRHKQRQLTRVAKMYLAAKRAQDRPCRFDVVSVVTNEHGKPSVEHFVNAFEPVKGG